MTGTQDRLLHAGGMVPPDQLQEYLRRVLRLDPDDVLALGSVLAMMSPKDAIAFVRPRLAGRPVRGEWHRAYQSLVERTDPDADLKPEYRKLVEETKRAPAAVYLLGRLEDGPAAEKLYEEAAAGPIKGCLVPGLPVPGQGVQAGRDLGEKAGHRPANRPCRGGIEACWRRSTTASGGHGPGRAGRVLVLRDS